jgi:PAS domain S-box-containing protein
VYIFNTPPECLTNTYIHAITGEVEEDEALAYALFEKRFTEVHARVVEAQASVVEFWEAVRRYSKTRDVEGRAAEVFRAGAKVNSSSNNARQTLDALVMTSRGSARCLMLYAFFLRHVVGDVYTADEMAKLCEAAQERVKDAMMIDNDGGSDDDDTSDIGRLNNTNRSNASSHIVTISGEEDDLGDILSVTHPLCTALGYKAHALIGKKIDFLLPEPFATLHDNFLRRYLQNGEMRVMNATRLLYMKHRAGYIVPVQTYITKSAAAVTGRLTFIGALRVRAAESTQYVITNTTDGTIHSATKGTYVRSTVASLHQLPLDAPFEPVIHCFIHSFIHSLIVD